MTRKKVYISVAVAIWLLGAVYLGVKARDAIRTDMIDIVEGRKTLDGEARWESLRNIVFPSLKRRDDEQ